MVKISKQDLLEAERKGATLREVAEKYGVSHEWVRLKFNEMGGVWGQSRRANMLSPHAQIISQKIADAREKRDEKALLEASQDVQDYATKRSWLIAEASFSWSVVKPWGGYEALAQIVRLSPQTLRAYSRTYRKFAEIARDYPLLNFSYFSILSSYNLTLDEVKELLGLVQSEGLSIAQFSVQIKDMLTDKKEDKD